MPLVGPVVMVGIEDMDGTADDPAALEALAMLGVAEGVHTDDDHELGNRLSEGATGKRGLPLGKLLRIGISRGKVGSPVVAGAGEIVLDSLGETVGMIEGRRYDVGCMLNEGRKDASNDSVGLALGKVLTVACEDVGVVLGCTLLLLGFEVDVEIHIAYTIYTNKVQLFDIIAVHHVHCILLRGLQVVHVYLQ